MAFFSKNQVSLCLSKKSLLVYSEKGADEKITAISLEKQNLVEALTQVAQTYNCSQAHLLIENELSYTVGIKYDSVSTPTREFVQQKIAQLVPESITTDNFDWKLVSQGNRSQYLQAFAINLDLLHQIKQASRESEFEIESIRPLPTIIANGLPDQKQVSLLLWVRWEPQLVATDKGTVIHSQNLVGFDAQEINTIKSYLEREYQELTFTHAFVDWPEHKNSETIAALAQLELTEVSLNPMKHILKTKNEPSQDEKNLHIVI